MGGKRKQSTKQASKSIPIDLQITKANPPGTYLSGISHWIPPEPKPLEIPLDWPSYFPNCLKVPVRPVIREAFKKFPDRKNLLDLCKYVVSGSTPHVCEAVGKGYLRPDRVDDVMQSLIIYLLYGNCDNQEELIRQTLTSDAWATLEDELAGIGQCVQQPAESRHDPNAKEVDPNSQHPEIPNAEDNQKFDPNKYGGVVSCLVVSYFKDGQHNLGKLASLVRGKVKKADHKVNVPEDLKQWAYRLRKKARDEGWWKHIPEKYWLSYSSR